MNRIISNFVCNHCHLGIAQTSLALHSAKSFILITVFTVLTFNVMAQQKIVQTAGRTQLGEFAPEFAHLNDDILFGEVWSRNDLLSLRDRSLVTITSLISQGITDSSLKYHLQSAKNNGTSCKLFVFYMQNKQFYCKTSTKSYTPEGSSLSVKRKGLPAHAV